MITQREGEDSDSSEMLFVKHATDFHLTLQDKIEINMIRRFVYKEIVNLNLGNESIRDKVRQILEEESCPLDNYLVVKLLP